MLILSRRPGQLLRVTPAQNLDPATPVQELFHDGPMEIIVTRVVGTQVDLGINAHPQLIILREEFDLRDWQREPAAHVKTLRRVIKRR